MFSSLPALVLAVVFGGMTCCWSCSPAPGSGAVKDIATGDSSQDLTSPGLRPVGLVVVDSHPSAW